MQAMRLEIDLDMRRSRRGGPASRSSPRLTSLVAQFVAPAACHSLGHQLRHPSSVSYTQLHKTFSLTPPRHSLSSTLTTQQLRHKNTRKDGAGPLDRQPAQRGLARPLHGHITAQKLATTAQERDRSCSAGSSCWDAGCWLPAHWSGRGGAYW